MTKNAVSVIGIIIAVALLILGFSTQVPEEKIGYNDYEEYVGGDAYNIQIEASLRGGLIAGAMSQRAIYFSASGVIFVISLFGLTNETQ